MLQVNIIVTRMLGILKIHLIIDGWMNYPNAYWGNGSYTYSNIPYVDYKMVFWYNNSVEHSAIVSERISDPSNGNYSELVIAVSKWGQAGLYKHGNTNSPYLYCNAITYYH